MFDAEDERWSYIRDALRGLLDDQAWAEARRTVLNAHYTDPRVVVAMWDAMRDLGFDAGRVLEPGCGSGNFLAYAPEGADMVGVERDTTTAAIARVLYPDAQIHAGPFETFDAHTPFDAAVGNVPFAKVVPTDSRYNRGRHALHNYFLAKSLQLVRPGGLVMALTSRYTLDARHPAARRELAQHGDLLGALRLPSGAMRAIAGTEAIVDLLVMRRRPAGAEPAGVTSWDRTVEVEVFDETAGAEATAWTNRYFAEHPQRVLGRSVLGRSMYRSGDLLVRGDLDDLGPRVADGLAAIVAEIDLRHEPAPPTAATPVGRSPVRRVADVDLRGDRMVPLRQRSFVVSGTGVVYRYQHGELIPAGIPQRATAEVRALVELRDGTVNLLRLEADDASDSDIESARRTLVDGYERYRRRWGPLNRVSWQRTGRIDPQTGQERRRRVPARLGGFREDPEWPTLAAIEVYDDDSGVATPAAILRQRTIHPPAPRLGAENPEEALAISLDELGRVDLDRVADLLGVEPDVARAEVEQLVYEDPASGALVPAEEYVSGDVRRKLASATAAAERDDRFLRNVEALGAVQPAQVGPGEIVVRPGAPWVEPHEIAAFAEHVLGISVPRVNYTASLGHWDVDSVGAARTAGLASDWGTARMSPRQLLEACLNQRLVRVYDTVDERRVLNVEQTAAAREKQELIGERFSRWVWEDPDRAAALAERYNALFNAYVPPDYRGDHLTFPGLTSTFVPHAHQRAAVARILREGRALLGHAVGAGKTATMVMAGMEMRRLGVADRPAYVVPNHMLEQFGRELLQLYPQARVLVTTRDLTGKAGREEFVARAATGDWDAVVITHSAFERLPLSQATYQRFLDDRTATFRANLEAAERAEGDSRGLVKRLEAAIAREEARLARLLDTAAKDDGVCFEETGIDQLMVDELHLFKNRSIVTAVEGVSAEGSKRATDLDAKLWYLHQARGPRVLVGATATPIANSISEAWVMQTYVQPDVLAEAGLDGFDAWAATFGQQVAAVELAPDGGSYRVTSRLARYQNVPELISMFRRTADIRTRDELDLRLPELKGGSPQVVVVPASDELKQYVASLVERAEQVRNRSVPPSDDNMLKITSDGRHAALDLRLVGERPDPAGGKLAAAAERIAQIHHATRHLRYLDETGNPSPRPGGFQLVFCDLSTPGKDRASWNAYDELKRRLLAAGLSADSIAFIHDAKNDEARAQLFARCRNGQVAVLIGSTSKMGVGTNIHTRAVALHHVDCPWRPADIEQREGRLIRQGNQNDEVQIFRYATEGSFDVYMWQTVERKGAFISQVMRGDAVGRDVEDVGDAVLSYSEVKALASGNPLVIEQAGVQADLAKYERLEHAHREEQRELERAARRLHEDARRWRHRTDALEAAIERRVDTSGDRFAMEVGGVRHRDRTDAGNALTARLQSALQALDRELASQELEESHLARLGGFDVTLSGYRLKDYRELRLTTRFGDGANSEVRLNSHDLDNPKLNVLARLEGPIRRLEAERERAIGSLEATETEARGVDARIGQPFPHRERLDKLRHRHQEILDQLNAHAEEAARSEPPRHGPGSAARPDVRLGNLKAATGNGAQVEGPSL